MEARASQSLQLSSWINSDKAFNKLKSGLLHCEVRLQKALDKERSLRLLCDEKKVELVDLQCEVGRSLNYENHLKEQLQKKTDALERLRDEVGRTRREHDELKTLAEAQALEGKEALAKFLAFEAQLCIASDNALVQTEMIAKLESELLKVRAEIIDDRAEAAMSRTKADHEMAIYSKNAADAQAELRRVLDRGGRIEEYARCMSLRKTLEEIRDKGFALSEELARARADERDARLLLPDAEDSEDKTDRP
ncbi:uncharacterized protein LOC107760066 [Nicotiana tabacum]|uniref:Uncharacterized protein LOC107760066 n=1 Tax=Nicotiana tabacum TaxID=4097 RepID=A0AC58RVN1_TOBAC